MKKIKVFTLLCVILLTISNGKAQTKNSTRILPGETIPNFSMEVFTGNKNQKNIHLYDIKKKLILFDIWGVNCSSCIKAMPHMLQLQQALKESAQIILVTKNTKEQVQALWKKLKGHVPPSIIGAYLKLPSVLDDSIITKSFPTNGVPTHIWIDSLYRFKAATYGSSTNLENMQAFINGKNVILDEQGTKKIDAGHPLSWLNKNNGFLPQLQYYSLLFSRIEHTGLGDRQVVPEKDSGTGKIIGLSCLNMSLIDLYKLAYFEYKSPSISVADNKILLEVKDTSKFIWEKDYSKFYAWADSSLYSFAIKVPLQNADSIYSTMHKLLDDYFHYDSKMEWRRVKCLVLKRISQKNNLRTTGHKPLKEISVTSSGSFLIMKNLPMDDLFLTLGSLVWYQNSFTPYFNETGYTQNIDITLPWKDNLSEISPAEVKKALREYGLDLVEEYKNLEMLVISDRTKTKG